jgi:heat shock protein HslJ
VPAAPLHSGTAPELAAPCPRLAAVPTRQTRLAIGLIVLAAVTNLAACAATAPALAERVFLSVAVTDGGAPRPLVAGTRIRLDFRASDLGASAGCNSIGGTYKIDGGSLVFESGAMTDMGCDAERAAQDQWLIKLLGSRPTVRLAGDELTLVSDATTVTLRDRRVVEPDVALVGPTWTVVSLMDGDAVSSVPGTAVATIVFAGDGSLTLHAGCNQGGATWVATGGGLQIAAIVLTKKACAGAEGQLESAVLAVLGSGTVGADIDSNVLTLQAGQRGLQLRAS